MTLREPRRLARVALALWGVWAVVAWNVTFDHVIEVAGRHYVQAAGQAARAGGPYARIDDWMRPAVTRGLWAASATGGAIFAVGLLGVRLSGARRPPCA